MVVNGEYSHRQRAEQHADHGAEWPGTGQEGRSGHHECAPADRITEGKRYDRERREIGKTAETFLFTGGCVRFILNHFETYNQFAQAARMKI